MSTSDKDEAAAETAHVSELARLLLEVRRSREEELAREWATQERAEAAHAKQIEDKLGII